MRDTTLWSSEEKISTATAFRFRYTRLYEVLLQKYYSTGNTSSVRASALSIPPSQGATNRIITSDP